MRISDWSSDVCSSDLTRTVAACAKPIGTMKVSDASCSATACAATAAVEIHPISMTAAENTPASNAWLIAIGVPIRVIWTKRGQSLRHHRPSRRSEEHTSELQSLMRISYAVFCLKKKKKTLKKKT